MIVDGFAKAIAAERFVFILFAKHHLLFAFHYAVTKLRQIAAAHADSVNFRNVLSNSHQCGHRTERIT